MDALNRLAFCPPDTPYFDTVEGAAAASLDYPLTTQAPPEPWTLELGGDWALLRHRDSVLPKQGWKVHVSAILCNAPETLQRVYDYLTANTTWVFKHLRGPEVLRRRSAKYGDRSSSGKFITIYPPDEEALERCLLELDEEVAGAAGPYILSDLRWERGPLYVRYGGFATRTVRSPTGEVVHVIEDPDGNLVPDQRGVGFHPPEWAQLPLCLEPAVRARNEGVLTDFPYRVSRALHFSNSGGIYRATDSRSGTEVLLREARPYAAEDVFGDDAVRRMEREHWALQQLADTPGVPEVIEQRTGHEHRFLVREYVDGESLAKAIQRNPLTAGGGDPESPTTAEYRDWALQVLNQVAEGVQEMHRRGVIFGDLHPGNLIVGTNGRIAFVDFETAAAADGHRGQVVGTPGFLAPIGSTGTQVDRYTLGCLRLAMFLPLAPAFGWHPTKIDEAIAFVRRRFGLGADFENAVRSDLAVGTPEPRPAPLLPGYVSAEAAHWPDGTDSSAFTSGKLTQRLVDGILGSAEMERTDRLYPADPPSVTDAAAGLDLRHGAAGVLWALHQAGVDPPAEHCGWLRRRATPQRLDRPGLYDGAAGVALVLDQLGHPGEARELLEHAFFLSGSPVAARRDPTLSSGGAGVALAALRLGSRWGDEALQRRAIDLGRELTRATLGAGGSGLLIGATGPAVLWSALAAHTGDPRWAEHAGRALVQDVRSLTGLCIGGQPADAKRPDATSRTGLLTTPAFGGGTALACRMLLGGEAPEYREELDAFVDRVIELGDDPLSVTSGLFHGQAGLLSVRAALSGPPQAARLAELGLFAVGHAGRLGFLGGDCLRLSADLSTGAAGVLNLITGLRRADRHQPHQTVPMIEQPDAAGTG